MLMSQSDPQESELTHGIWIQLLDEGAIVAVRIATIERPSLDCLSRWLEARLSAWDALQPWLAMYDVTAPNVMLTLYMRRRVFEFAVLRPEVRGRVAFVMRRDAATMLFNLLQSGTSRRAREWRVWFDRQQALAWLRELL